MYRFSFLTALFVVMSFPLTAWSAGPSPSPRDLAERLMETWESGKISDIEELFAPDATYDDVPNGRLLVGHEEIAGYVQHVHAWASEIEIELTAVHAGPTSAAAEWIMSAIQDRPIPGRVPVATNRRIELRGLTLVECEDGRIRRAADYIDVASFVMQLGGRLVLPGTDEGAGEPSSQKDPR